jgi:SAM-dependent methyltransferase
MLLGVSDRELPTMRDAWEAHAAEWAAWARTPGHDHFFWNYNLPRFLEIVPPPGRLTLDVGGGEGRLGRVLAGLGHRVVAIDASPTLARLATTNTHPVPTAIGDAAALPVANGAADLAIAFMSLQDVDDLPGAVVELGRAVRVGGMFCMAILHPLSTIGEFADDGDDAQYVVSHSYGEPRRFVDSVERDGLTMEFHSMHRPLAAYTEALRDAGFVIDVLREPVPDARAIAQFPRLARQARVPWFLHLGALRTS